MVRSESCTERHSGYGSGVLVTSGVTWGSEHCVNHYWCHDISPTLFQKSLVLQVRTGACLVLKDTQIGVFQAALNA